MSILDNKKIIIIGDRDGDAVNGQAVAEFLTRQQFSQVANLVGGIDAWSLHVDPQVPRY